MLRMAFGTDESQPLDVLCIGAHSDDIEIGCGGTILRLLVEHPGDEGSLGRAVRHSGPRAGGKSERRHVPRGCRRRLGRGRELSGELLPVLRRGDQGLFQRTAGGASIPIWCSATIALTNTRTTAWSPSWSGTRSAPLHRRVRDPEVRGGPWSAKLVRRSPGSNRSKEDRAHRGALRDTSRQVLVPPGDPVRDHRAARGRGRIGQRRGISRSQAGDLIASSRERSRHRCGNWSEHGRARDRNDEPRPPVAGMGELEEYLILNVPRKDEDVVRPHFLDAVGRVNRDVGPGKEAALLVRVAIDREIDEVGFGCRNSSRECWLCQGRHSRQWSGPPP